METLLYSRAVSPGKEREMKAQLEIKYDGYDGSWIVEVTDFEDITLFFNRTAFKWSAWISFFIWKYITRKFQYGKNVYKDIEL